MEIGIMADRYLHLVIETGRAGVPGREDDLDEIRGQGADFPRPAAAGNHPCLDDLRSL